MQIPIEDLVLKKRIRKNLGDVSTLAESIRRVGLINPILINKKNVLIAGRRRLEAAKLLGWRTIPAVVIDARDELSKLELELEENLHRSELFSDEISKAEARIRKLRNPSWLRRIWNAVVAFFSRLFSSDQD